MRVFKRELVETHCVGAEWPTFCGRVELGEPFVIETQSLGANGPVEIAGVRAGDPIAIHVEAIEMEGPFSAPNGGPFMDGPRPRLEYRDGAFIWPNHFRLKAEPSIGNVAILPEPTEEILAMSREYEYSGNTWPNDQGWRRVVRDPRGKHCHQDCRALGVGAMVHMNAQVDGAGVCLEDVHGYIGEGEMSYGAIEVNGRVRLRVERSTGWHVNWPIVETNDEIMVCSSYSSAYSHRPPQRYVDVVREAYRAMTEVVAAKIGGTIEEANTIVATAVDIRNCALYGLQGFISEEDSPNTYDIAVVAALPKSVFVD